jgi:hypothetical protein
LDDRSEIASASCLSRSPREVRRTTLHATFGIDGAELEAIRSATITGNPIDRTYNVDLIDADGVVHASIEKLIYVKKRES